MGNLKNHPGKWLRDDAAISFNALEDDHGIFVVNSAGRTEAEQQHLIDRWDAGGAKNRPPHLFYPARPANTSSHVKDGGLAVDIGGDKEAFAKVCSAYGFTRPSPVNDPVHFVFTRIATKPNTPKPTLHIGTVVDLKSLSDSRGLQYIAKDYGYKGPIDNKFGAGSQSGFTKFLLKKYDGSLATWLRTKWGYDDSNDYWGPNMKAAAERANAANYRVYTK